MKKKTPVVLDVALYSLLAVGAVVLLVTLFGDNVRRLFSLSADALAGSSEVIGRYPVGANMERKKMLDFAKNNFYGDEGAQYHPGTQPSGHFEAVAPLPAVTASADRFSTFAIDVDTASYAFFRTQVNAGVLPHKDSVRLEEWVNAFKYDLPQPSEHPFAIDVEGAPSPFSEGRYLLKVALQGKAVKAEARKPAHLVFLVDTSGSMNGPERLGLAQWSMKHLVSNLNARDTVAIVTYAGDVRDVLPPTSAEDLRTLNNAIDSLASGGGTAMGSGLELAYRHAVKHVAPGHVSRVMVFTDGDANVGATKAGDMLTSISAYVKQGVTLTTVGFGMGNYRADTLEQLADQGNGQALYVDGQEEARKVFGGERLSGTLEVIAKDVKVQVEFDPAKVKTYRLLGYENRDVKDQDFRNDEVDGGEIGAGHSVTALYEVELLEKGAVTEALGTVRVRGMKPDSRAAFEVSHPVGPRAMHRTFGDAGSELKFAIAVSQAAELSRGNVFAPGASFATVLELAKANTRGLAEREQFCTLLEKAQNLQSTRLAAAPHPE